MSDPIAAPALDYRPRDPRRYRPGIGVIGCGGISAQHLTAYRRAGYDVVALCSRTEASARARRDAFFPAAAVVPDHHALLARPDIAVVDITPHPDVRPALVEDALRAGKHVLSQKPFVTDLDTGERLVALADDHGVKLAVNQNGRWAPHFAAMRAALAQGLLGELTALDFQVHWDHGWVVGTPFDATEHLILFDFGIHWFDIASALFGDREPRRVFASTAFAPGQRARQPMLAHAVVDFDQGRATFAWNGHSPLQQIDSTTLVGTRGAMHSTGPDLQQQRVTLHTAAGSTALELEGKWFPDGFHGTMAELLCAVEEDRQPSHAARANLRSLQLAFAACASATRGEPVTPGDVRRL